MAVYGPGCHPQNITWTEAKLRFIYYFVGDRPVHNCHLSRSAMNYLLYYTQYMQICQTTCFCYCIFKTKTEFEQNSEENIILIGPGQYTKIFNGQYTKILTGCANKDK